MISKNVIIMWAGTHASIPTGYTRETLLDSKYPKSVAAGVNPGTRTGGAATHTHTSTAHTHTIAAHTHTYTLASGGATLWGCAPSGSGSSMGDLHTHTGTSGAISGGVTGSTAVTYAACSNNPAYYTVIFIKASGKMGIPDDAIIWWNTSTIPTGFTRHSASDGRFYAGASTGANGGSTGGSVQNVHVIDHTHTAGSHTHSAANSSAGTGTRAGTDADTDNATWNHVHSISLATQSVSIPSYSGSLTTTETNIRPPYTSLLAVQNTSGVTKGCTKGMVAIWLGTLATIPRGYYLCNGSNGTPNLMGTYKYIRNETTPASVLSTGGSVTHTHAAQNHTHSASSGHTHTYSSQNHTTGGGGNSSSQHCSRTTYNPHPADTSASTTASYAAGSTSAASSNNEPAYKEVAYIMFNHSIGEGGMLLNFGL